MPCHDVSEDEGADDVHGERRPEDVEFGSPNDIAHKGAANGTKRTAGRYREPSSAGDRRRKVQSVGHGER